MAQVKITINGKELPCRPTMGAMLRFKKETGKEVTEIKENDFSDLLSYLYFCVLSACSHDKIPFEMSLLEFADSIEQSDMITWMNSIEGDNTEAEGEQEKKSL